MTRKMTRKRFDEILKREGIKSKSMRDEMWNTRPTDNLNEKKLRRAAQAFKRAYPWAC